MFSFRYVWNRKIHISIFIAWFSIALTFGVALSVLNFEWLEDISWLVFGIILLTVSFTYRRVWLVMVVITSGLLLGLWRGSIEQSKLHQYDTYIGDSVVLRGIINEDPTKNKKGESQIQLRMVTINNTRQMTGMVWVSIKDKKMMKRSDMIELKGVVKNGFGSFGASMPYATVSRHIPRQDTARDVRDWFSDIVRRFLSEPEASLGIGFLVGQRSQLPTGLDEQLRIVGLTHIVVASGYNLTILVRLCRRVFKNVSKYLTALSSSLLIIGFMLVTGFSPSMSRAGLVAGFSLAAWYYGRKISPFILLPLVAAISVLVNPSYIWGDVGWYLSFAAFGGVMIVAPLLQDYFFGKKKPNLIRQILGETLAALVVTAPIIALVFGQYSTYALIANLLVVPIIPLVMLTVFITGLAGIIIPSIASIVSLPALVLLHYIITVVDEIRKLPEALLTLQVSFFLITLFYVILIFFLLYAWHKTHHDFRSDNLVE